MSEDNGDILSMSDGDIEYLDQAGAKSLIDKTMRTIGATKGHPYLTVGHPDHTRYVNRMSQLYQKASPEPEPIVDPETGEVFSDQPSREIVAAMSEALDSRAQLENKQLEEAEALLEEMEDKLGFEIPDGVLDDFQPWKLGVWRMQKLNAERNFDELGNIMGKELRNMKEPPDVVAAFETFSRAKSLNPDMREKIGEQIVEYIYNMNNQKWSK
jgi:hypothetical protein